MTTCNFPLRIALGFLIVFTLKPIPISSIDLPPDFLSIHQGTIEKKYGIDSAIAYIQPQLISLYKQAATDSIARQLLIRHNTNLFKKAKFPASIEHLSQIVKSLEGKNESEQYRFKTVLVAAYGQNGDYDKALKTVQEVLGYHKYEKNSEQEGLMYHSMGNIYLLQNQCEKAVEKYLKADSVFTLIGNHKRLNKSRESIATCYIKLSYFDKALKSYTDIIDKAIELKDSLGLAQAKTNMAQLLHYMKNTPYDSIIMIQKEALAIYKKFSQTEDILKAYNNIGAMYSLDGQYAKALEYQLKVLDLYTKNNASVPRMMPTYFGLAKTYQKLGNYNESSRYFNLYESHAQDLSYLDLHKLYLYQAKNDAALKAYKNAYERLKKGFSELDSAFVIAQSEKMAEIDAKYQTEKKEIQNQLLVVENEKKTAYIWSMGLGGTFVIIGLLGFLTSMRFRNKALRSEKELMESSQQELERANRELRQKINSYPKAKDRIKNHTAPQQDLFITIPQKEEDKSIKIADIRYIKSDRNYIDIYVEGEPRPITYRATLKGFRKDWLPEEVFQRIHRSHIVNINQISKKNSKTLELVHNGKSVTLDIGSKYEKLLFNSQSAP